MTLGITLGDPAGIGPDLLADLLAGDYVVYGDRGVLDAAAARRGLTFSAELVEVTRLSAVTPGLPTRETGAAQVAYLEAAVADAKAGRLKGLVTAPINKAAARAAGFQFPGHTEYLADRLAGGAPVTMMLAGPRLRVTIATTHVALTDITRFLSVERLAVTIGQTARAMRDQFGLAHPRVAVAGLNPHAGESGHFGDEEARLVTPAIERARREHPYAEITGPHVPDVVFRRARLDKDAAFDVVVALYHDQGLIPVKLVDFEDAVNVTLGLPIVRTSPDHGVAYDVAGTPNVRTTSFRAALGLAQRFLRSPR